MTVSTMEKNVLWPWALSANGFMSSFTPGGKRQFVLSAYDVPISERGGTMKRQKPDHISQADWDSVESPKLSESFLAGMKPVAVLHADMPSRVRGPQKAPRKAPVSLRIDESTIKAFRSTGRGWQTRINEILRDWIREHEHA